MRLEEILTAVAGVIVALLGWSYLTWGNWIPVAPTYNNTTAVGIIQIILGGFMIIVALSSIVYNRPRKDKQ